MNAAMWESDLSPYGVTLTFGAHAARIALAGQLDVASGSALIDAATSAVARYRFLDLDLTGVTSLDGPALRSLVKVRRLADAYDVSVAVIGLSAEAAEAIATSEYAREFGLSGPS